MERLTRWQGATPRSGSRRFTRRRLVVWGTALVGGLCLLLAALGVMGAVAGDHTLGSVDYGQAPPHSGDHSPVWQHCGFYGEAIGSEHAVHSLEHGAVWITYRSDLPTAQREALRALAQSQDEIIVSPFPDLPAPVVASAWGQQVSLDGADDPRLAQFVGEFRNHPDGPEPDGTCDGPNLWLSGGTGDPES